jgi:hypothetical protein
MPRQQWADIEFLGAVEPKVRLGDFLPQEAVCADDPWFYFSKAITREVVNHKQVVTNFVESTNISADQRRLRIGNCTAFFEKYLVPQFLSFPKL